MKTPVLLCSVALTLTLAASAQAANIGFTANNNGAEYWDNTSADGVSCNIGFVVLGVAGSPGNNCANQSWLPFTNTSPAFDVYNDSQQFTYFGGSITIQQAPGVGGDVSSQNRAWGLFTSTTLLGSKTLTDLNGGALPFTVNLTGLFWGLWVNTTDGAFRYSDSSSQFARFARSGCVGTVICGPTVIGIEEVEFVNGGGDRDFQDVVVLISESTQAVSTVPEPSTCALMAGGLAALGMVARRRRNA